MFNVRLADGHLFGKWLFTWLSLLMTLMVSYFMPSFSHEMFWMRSGTEFRQFLGIFVRISAHCLSFHILCQGHVVIIMVPKILLLTFVKKCSHVRIVRL